MTVFVVAMGWAFCWILEALHFLTVDAYEFAQEVDASGCDFDFLLAWDFVTYLYKLCLQTYFCFDFCSLDLHEQGSEVTFYVQGVDSGSN